MRRIAEQVWIALVLLTGFAYLLGNFHLVGSGMVSVLLLSTFIKGKLIIDYFMGLKNVQYKYRFIPIVWLALILCLIAVAYYYY